MGSRKTLGVYNREKTRSRRDVAKAAGNCTRCFTEPAVRKTICPAGVPGGNWCTASPAHDHETVATATCKGCRAKKTAKRATAKEGASA
jgi:hypothetical protein